MKCVHRQTQSVAAIAAKVAALAAREEELVAAGLAAAATTGTSQETFIIIPSWVAMLDLDASRKVLTVEVLVSFISLIIFALLAGS